MRTVHYLNDEQTAIVLASLNKFFFHKKTTRPFLRFRLIVLLMLDAGLRVGEVVQLLWSALVSEHEPVVVLYVPASITKTKESRQIPLTPRLKTAIQDYYSLLFSASNFDLSTFVFSGTNGRDYITTRSVQLLLKKVCDCCLDVNVTPHMLRHSFATRIMRHAPLSVLQQLLGHKRLSSTGIYLHPTISDSIKAIKNMGG